jgi:hypothetical protein
MKLLEAQFEFVKSLTRLFTWAELNGYDLTLGEAYRPDWVAKEYAKQHKGIVNSLHCSRCAIDLNLFKRGVMMVSVEDYRPMGEFWISMSIPELDHRWGGVFNDANHFSVSIDERG